MRRRSISIMTRGQLEAMPTRSLLGRLQRLRECEESVDRSDLESAEIAALTGINFKADRLWSQAYDQVKTILETREHVLRAAERGNATLVRAPKRKGNDRSRPQVSRR
jgi:hypothetical protein